MRRCFMALSACLLALAIMAALRPRPVLAGNDRVPATEASKAPIPSVDAQKTAMGMVQEVYKDELAKARKPEDRVASAWIFLQAAANEKDAAGRYVLLALARDQAIEAGELEVALRAMDAIDRYYAFDLVQAQTDAVIVISKSLRTVEERARFVAIVDAIVERQIRSDRFEVARQLADLVLNNARACGDAAMIRQAMARDAQMREIEAAVHVFKQAMATLAGNGADPQANLAAGRFRCFMQEDWKHGLPMLERSDDGVLGGLARLELTEGLSAGDKLKLADAWWDISEQNQGQTRIAMRARAVATYAALQAGLQGLEKARVLKRMADLAAEQPNLLVVDPQTSAAMAMAMKWFAGQQRTDGSWSFTGGDRDKRRLDSPVAATAMVLESFVLAGNSTRHGEYAPDVKKALAYLSQRGKKASVGMDFRDGGSMYVHAVVAITLCELYGRTRDVETGRLAQEAVNFIVDGQDPKGGGWRYAPRETGDTSATGWQLHALSLAEEAKLHFPNGVLAGANLFLDAAQTGGGSGYKYDPKGPDSATKPMTAVGLLSRLWAHHKKDAAFQTGVDSLVQAGVSEADLYFDFYATMLLKDMGGSVWDQWKGSLRHVLLGGQQKDGPDSGSWGGFNGSIPDNCGRLGVAAICVDLLVYSNK